ncbi:hypothetical protein D5086_033727 [Populus alba]|uniref:Uncharacterized protein n=1 Tax=Populus alba TaxID=43335 RepID=A0ACC4AHK6_POPAL
MWLTYTGNRLLPPGYGSPDGDGSDGARVGAVSPVLFKNGEGCGACYKVRCLDKSICSRRAVTIIVTDECPGGYLFPMATLTFDLSGAAFGRMAISGENGQLRNRGPHASTQGRTLPSMSMKAQQIIGYPF